MIVIVDFDGTLTTGYNNKFGYLEPNIFLIQRLQELKKKYNCTIKIVTAKGSKSNLSYEEKVARYDGQIRDFLLKNNVPFNEISYNKEYGHLYIDDMTISQNSPFEGYLSPFTKNKIIFTEGTVIKYTKSSKFEAEWYQKSITNVPKVLFYNDELIITERIKNISNPNIQDYITLLDNFQNNNIDNWEFESYKENLKYIKYQSDRTKKIVDNLKPTHPTFFHGDLSTSNVLKSDKVYLIDPNYKQIFGSYLTDAGKLFFSLVAFNYDYDSANILINRYGKRVLEFAVCEGLRVCKYNEKYISIVNNISDLLE